MSAVLTKVIDSATSGGMPNGGTQPGKIPGTSQAVNPGYTTGTIAGTLQPHTIPQPGKGQPQGANCDGPALVNFTQQQPSVITADNTAGVDGNFWRAGQRTLNYPPSAQQTPTIPSNFFMTVSNIASVQVANSDGNTFTVTINGNNNFIHGQSVTCRDFTTLPTMNGVAFYPTTVTSNVLVATISGVGVKASTAETGECWVTYRADGLGLSQSAEL